MVEATCAVHRVLCSTVYCAVCVVTGVVQCVLHGFGLVFRIGFASLSVCFTPREAEKAHTQTDCSV